MSSGLRYGPAPVTQAPTPSPRLLTSELPSRRQLKPSEMGGQGHVTGVKVIVRDDGEVPSIDNRDECQPARIPAVTGDTDTMCIPSIYNFSHNLPSKSETDLMTENHRAKVMSFVRPKEVVSDAKHDFAVEECSEELINLRNKLAKTKSVINEKISEITMKKSLKKANSRSKVNKATSEVGEVEPRTGSETNKSKSGHERDVIPDKLAKHLDDLVARIRINDDAAPKAHKRRRLQMIDAEPLKRARRESVKRDRSHSIGVNRRRERIPSNTADDDYAGEESTTYNSGEMYQYSYS